MPRRTWTPAGSREALALLEAGPLPDEAADVVALRKGELALQLGDAARARAELTPPALVRPATASS